MTAGAIRIGSMREHPLAHRLLQLAWPVHQRRDVRRGRWHLEAEEAIHHERAACRRRRAPLHRERGQRPGLTEKAGAASGGHLSAEDLKELEDLDLSGLDPGTTSDAATGGAKDAAKAAGKGGAAAE